MENEYTYEIRDNYRTDAFCKYEGTLYFNGVDIGRDYGEDVALIKERLSEMADRHRKGPRLVDSGTL